MSSEIKNVILVGASAGNLGQHVITTFTRDAPHFNLTVLSRTDSTSKPPANIPVLRADYTSVDSLAAAFKGQDAVISLVGAPFFAKQTILVDAAIAAGVKLFIPSEFGSDTADEAVRKAVPIFEAKKGIVDYLKEREDKISWTAVATGAFFDWGITSTFLGFNAATKTATLIDSGTHPYTTTNLHTIGLALISLLTTPSLARNQFVYISSFTPTTTRVLSAVEKITGEKWTVKHVDSETLIKESQEKIARGDFSGIGGLIQGALFGKEGLGDLRSKGTEEWNRKLGLPAGKSESGEEDLEASVKAGLEGRVYGLDG